MSTILQRTFPHVAGMIATPQTQSDRLRREDGLSGEKIEETAKKHTHRALSCDFISRDLRVMIRGTSTSNNTALLFQFAVSCAMEGQVVMFITHERFASLPVPVEGARQPDPVLMKQVHIKYFADRTSFLRELAGIHTSSPVPDVIIVDSLDYYISNPKTNNTGQVTASVCAHLVDAATFIHNQRVWSKVNKIVTFEDAVCRRDALATLHKALLRVERLRSKSDSSNALSTPSCVLVSVTTPSSNSLPQCHDVYGRFFPTTFSISDLEDTNMKQLQCWYEGEELPQYVVTFEVGDTIKVVDVMAGAELNADWSQTSSMVT